MKNFGLIILSLITLISCSLEDKGYYFTFTGKVQAENNSELENIPMEGIEVMVRSTKCVTDYSVWGAKCEFLKILDERSFTDEQGVYSITFFHKSPISYDPEIVVPDGYKIVLRGGIEDPLENNSFEYNFLLAPSEE